MGDDPGTAPTEVIRVPGTVMRDHVDTDFTGGTNDQANPEYCPQGAILIEAGIPDRDALAYLVHELAERSRMKNRGQAYPGAHQEATAVEKEFRAKTAAAPTVPRIRPPDFKPISLSGTATEIMPTLPTLRRPDATRSTAWDLTGFSRRIAEPTEPVVPRVGPQRFSVSDPLTGTREADAGALLNSMGVRVGEPTRAPGLKDRTGAALRRWAPAATASVVGTAGASLGLAGTAAVTPVTQGPLEVPPARSQQASSAEPLAPSGAPAAQQTPGLRAKPVARAPVVQPPRDLELPQGPPVVPEAAPEAPPEEPREPKQEPGVPGAPTELSLKQHWDRLPAAGQAAAIGIPAAALLYAVLRKKQKKTGAEANWLRDYPLTTGAPATAAVGGALGLLLHVVKRRVDPKYRGSFLGPVILGATGGAALGAGLAAGRDPQGLQGQLAKEIEEGKYDRNGPFRQTLRALRPMIPVREGTQDYPEDFRANIKEPFRDLPDTVALGGRVSPQETRINVSSPGAPAKGFWRQGFQGGRPKEFFTLDDLLTKAIGPPEDSSSYTGSETLGSPVQYDYNDANDDVFRVPKPGDRAAPEPLKPGDRSVMIAGHASSNPLSSVAGVKYVDILKDLAQRGQIPRDVNDLTLRTCNTEGCDIPNDVVKAALGRTPQRVTSTPPGATGTAGVEATHRRWIQARDDRGTRLMDSELLRPRRITTVDANAGDTPESRVLQDSLEPGAAQTVVQPVIPTKATRWVADRAGQLSGPLLNRLGQNPNWLRDKIRGATKTHDYATSTFNTMFGGPRDWDEASTLIPQLRSQLPKGDWFKSDD